MKKIESLIEKTAINIKNKCKNVKKSNESKINIKHKVHY